MAGTGRRLSVETAKKVLDSFDTFLFDCDGVLWRGDDPIHGAAQVLSYLRNKGKRVIFVSNNSTSSRTAYTKKFSKMGLDATEKEIFCSAYAAGAYLSKMGGFSQTNGVQGKKVYIVGESGIAEELEAAGISWIGGPSDVGDKLMEETLAAPIDPQVGAVVVGLDRRVNYYKIATAQAYLRSTDCMFVATNADASFPAPGRLAPGSGSIVAAIATASSRQPVVLGKPNNLLLDLIIENYHLNRSSTLMIGDRIDTDILFGKAGGLGTLLVLSGVTHENDLDSIAVNPDYIANSIVELLHDL